MNIEEYYTIQLCSSSTDLNI